MALNKNRKAPRAQHHPAPSAHRPAPSVPRSAQGFGWRLHFKQTRRNKGSRACSSIHPASPVNTGTEFGNMDGVQMAPSLRPGALSAIIVQQTLIHGNHQMLSFTNIPIHFNPSRKRPRNSRHAPLSTPPDISAPCSRETGDVARRRVKFFLARSHG